MKGWEHVDRTDTGIQTGRRMTNRTEQTDKERGEDKDWKTQGVLTNRTQVRSRKGWKGIKRGNENQNITHEDRTSKWNRNCQKPKLKKRKTVKLWLWNGILLHKEAVMFFFLKIIIKLSGWSFLTDNLFNNRGTCYNNWCFGSSWEAVSQVDQQQKSSVFKYTDWVSSVNIKP